MTAKVLGRTEWSMVRDRDGHRTYTIVHEVEADPEDGPAIVLTAPGLPQIGDMWTFGNDIDAWAFCLPDAKVRMIKKKEPNRFWEVEQVFSTKPLYRCMDTRIEDPLLEPQKIGGSFVKYTKEAQYDRHGDLIQSSSHEQFRGPQVEFDESRPKVWIEQNVPDLELGLVSSMMDHVNDRDLWGLEKRKIKLSQFSWERKFYGVCNVYYTRRFEFDINFHTFDRDLLDEGTKVLHGEWDPDTAVWRLTPIDKSGTMPDKDNPDHFIRFKDRKGENARVLLDGEGKPAKFKWAVGSGTVRPAGAVATIHVEVYEEANFLLLGIPTTL